MTYRNRLLGLAGLLAVAGVLGALAPAVGAVRAADGSVTDPLLSSAWLILLPALLVLVLAFARPSWANAAAAGIGFVGAVRIVADLGVLADPTNSLRPELFSITTSNAPPLTASAGTWLAILSDLLFLLTAILAAGSLFAALPELPAVGLGTPDGSRRPKLARSPWVMAVGLIGAALLLGSVFSPQFDGINPPPGLVRNLDVGIAALGGGALTGLLVMLGVFLAASLPKPEAAGLLIGAGLTSMVPPLIAVTAPVFSNGVSASFTGWLGLVAGFLIMGAGLVQRSPAEDSEPSPLPAPEPDRDIQPLSAVWSYLPSALALLAAGLAVFAANSQQARQVDDFIVQVGQPDAAARAVQESVTSGPAAQGLIPAAVFLVIAAALALFNRLGAIGRYALIAAAVAALAATAYGFEFLSSLNLANLVYLDRGLWEAASGLTLGLIAAGVAVLAVATVIVRDNRRAEFADVEDEPWDDRDPWNHWAAAGLAVFAGLTYLLPTFEVFQHGAGPQALGGFRMQDYGALLGLAAILYLLWRAGRTTSRLEAVGALVIAAALVATRIILPPSVQSLTDFHYRAGFGFSITLAVLLLVAAPASWLWLRAPALAKPAAKSG